jgi:TRAP-type C4-dicarboxylate transport system permease small subunit
MKLLTKITNGIARAAEWVVMAIVAGLVFFIVSELFRRNLLNTSWLPTTELCGILFLWMAFIGLIPLYNAGGLMRLDFLVTRLKGAAAQIVWYMTVLVSGALGIVMIVAFVAQYPFVSTRFYATMPHLAYTIQYVPMGLAGAFIALKSAEILLNRIFGQKGGKTV